MTIGLKDDANKIVNRYAKWTAGAGLIPVPLLDIATISSLQIKMLADLAKLYNLSFGKERANILVSSLIGSVLPSVLASTSLAAVGTIIKTIPVLGTVVGMAALPGFAYAATKAVGAVFIAHFEAGGTLLDFDAEKTREYFRKEFEAEATSKDLPVSGSGEAAA
jgi:Uncharacterized protein/domain associated with GTPases